MNADELKFKLSALWKETFHDSDKYVSLIFDNYFDPELCACEQVDGVVVAGLIGIPYLFGNKENNLKGLYLCGLATKPRFRSRGIMTRLLVSINEKARQKGFAFTFLIPADAGLRKYYRDREYVNAFYRVVDNYTSLHDFELEYESILSAQKAKVVDLKRHYYESLKVKRIGPDSENPDDLTDKVIEKLYSIESTQGDFQIFHSKEDLKVIIEENGISGGSVFVVETGKEEVTAVAFVTVSKNESTVNIHKLYTTDLASKYKVLDAVKKAFPELGIRHYVPSIDMDRKALWSRTYGSFMPESPQAGSISITERVYSLAAHAKVYGMARVVNLSEILKFQANQRRDLKYSILAKGVDTYTYDKIDVRDGCLTIRQQTLDTLTPAQAAYMMSRRDICEILFRRRDTDNLITEAFGIPSINGAISLLLD